MTATFATRTTLSTGSMGAGGLSALVIGCGMTLSLAGYHFGTSNHTVYLVDALHRVHPELLGRDWFTTGTLQYHAVFGLMAEGLMRLHLLAAGFLVGYLALVILLHLGMLRLVRRLGGDAGSYLLTVLFFELSAAGAGLGFYQFLQDGSLLPSNVAAVAMLWGVVMWMDRKWMAAGACMGIAGLAHLDYAVVGPVVWVGLALGGRARGRRLLFGSVIVLALCGVNGLLAVRAGLLRPGAAMPLREFIDLYVRLRHPHHYDPRSWPLALWVSFLWPFPFAWVGFRRNRDAALLLGGFCGLLLFALIFAGLFYVSAAVVQLSLYRFSVFPKLLTCAGTAVLFTPARTTALFRVYVPAVAVGAVVLRFIPLPPRVEAQVPAVAVFQCFVCLIVIRHTLVSGRGGHLGVAAAGLAMLVVCWGQIGLRVVPEDDSAYLEMCRYVAGHTASDAVLLVPPDEQAMRLVGRRAIVVNYKGVPQLARELPEWDRRLREVLGVGSLMALPRGFGRTLAAVRAAYDRRSPGALAAVADRYGAGYVVTDHRVPQWGGRLVHDADGRYFLYYLAGREGE